MDPRFSLWGQPIRIVNQAPGSSSCVGCVASMIVDVDLATFEAWMGESGGPWSDECLITWLVGHGVTMGWSFQFEGQDVDEVTEYTLGARLLDRPAYLGVDSPTRPGEFEHAVLWNGRFVFDPLQVEPQELSQYKVMTMAPIFKANFHPVLAYKILGEDLARRAEDWHWGK